MLGFYPSTSVVAALKQTTVVFLVRRNRSAPSEKPGLNIETFKDMRSVRNVTRPSKCQNMKNAGAGFKING